MIFRHVGLAVPGRHLQSGLVQWCMYFSWRELHLHFDLDTTEGAPIILLQDFDMEIYAGEWEPLPDDSPS